MPGKTTITVTFDEPHPDGVHILRSSYEVSEGEPYYKAARRLHEQLEGLRERKEQARVDAALAAEAADLASYFKAFTRNT